MDSIPTKNVMLHMSRNPNEAPSVIWICLDALWNPPIENSSGNAGYQSSLPGQAWGYTILKGSFVDVSRVRGTRLKSRLTCRNLFNALRRAPPAPTNSKYVLCRTIQTLKVTCQGDVNRHVGLQGRSSF